MEIKSDVLHNLIDLEIENIDFLLELINANKNLSLSLINTFVSTIEFHNTSDDLEFFNKMLMELQVSINDNTKIQSELEEIKALFEKITSRLDKNTLVEALDALKEKQPEVHQIELKLYSYTPKLLNKVNQNILNIKQKDLRDEIQKVIPREIKNIQLETVEVPVNEVDTNIEEKVIQPENENTDNSIENIVSEEHEETIVEKHEEEITPKEEMTQIEKEIESEIAAIADINSEFEIPNPSDLTASIEVVDDSDSHKGVEEKTAEVVTVTIPEKVPENTGEEQDNHYETDSLIISEITGEVILPFTHTVVNINEFKNPVSSRFREGYRLSREREHEGVLMSISIGMKLCFKSNIHPAIIRACRDFDDLDTYLFYLGNNQADYYPNFKILYKSYPMKNYLS